MHVSSQLEFRPVTPSDEELLFTATLGNVNWSVERFAIEDVRQLPELRHYATPWDPEHDFGLVAGDARDIHGADGNPDGNPDGDARHEPGPIAAGTTAGSGLRVAGVVWLKRFTAEDPGFGYLSDDIPELSIWVHDDLRGGGIGSELMRRAIALTRARGLRGISLSTEPGNPARRLYERNGFREEAPSVYFLEFDGARG